MRGRCIGLTMTTDTPFRVPFAHLWRVCGGRLAWMQQYIDTAAPRDAIEGRLVTAPG